MRGRVGGLLEGGRLLQAARLTGRNHLAFATQASNTQAATAQTAGVQASNTPPSTVKTPISPPSKPQASPAKREPPKIDLSFNDARYGTLIKKEIKFSTYRRKFRMEQLQSHI
jgi:hypothetical protein